MSHSVQSDHAVILLASGLSVRLGEPKQLLSKQGQTLLEIMTEISLVNNPSVVMLVIPADHADICNIAQNLVTKYSKLKLIINDKPHKGISASLKLGIEGLRELNNSAYPLNRVLIMSVDQILLDASHIRNMLSVYDQQHNQDHKHVVASSYLSTPHIHQSIATPSNHIYPIIGIPLLIDFNLLKQWQHELQGDKGLRHLIRNMDDHILSVVSNNSLSVDIDTLQHLDYARAKGWLD